jgi:hypothetical protein
MEVKNRDSSVGIALGYGLDDRGSRVRFPAGLGISLYTTASGTALGPTQPPIQWVPGTLSLGVKRPGVKLTTHLHLVPRLKISGAIHPLTLRLHGVVLSLKKHRDNFTFTF